MLSLAVTLLALAPLRFETKGGETTIIDGSSRLNLSRAYQREVRLKGGVTLVYDTTGFNADTFLLTRSGKRTLDFTGQIADWLGNDSIWGKKHANDLRYTNSRRQGIKGQISEVIAVPGGQALCILNFRATFMSGVPVIEQLLVRLDPSAPERPNLIQVLPGEVAAHDLNYRATQRLYRWKEKDLIWLGDRFAVLNADGTTSATVVPSPRGAPMTQIRGRYVPMFVQVGSNHYDVFDLQKKKVFTLLTGRETPQESVWMDTSLESDWLVASVWSQGKEKRFLMRVPDGKRVQMPDSTDLIWKDYAIDRGGDQVIVYRLPSGKVVARYRYPNPQP